jgi:hypothetical protein
MNIEYFKNIVERVPYILAICVYPSWSGNHPENYIYPQEFRFPLVNFLTVEIRSIYSEVCEFIIEFNLSNLV